MGRTRTRVLGASVAAAMVGSLLLAPPASAGATASIGGTITDRVTQQPIAGACVVLWETFRVQEAARTCTDASGRYLISGLPDNLGVKVRVTAEGYAEQWSGDKPDYANAQLLGLSPTNPPVQNFALRTGAGSVSGTITDPEGNGAGQTTITMSAASGGWSARVVTRTDGTFNLANIPPGDYRVMLQRSDLVTQWYEQASSSTTATLATVTDGQDRVIKDQFLQRRSTAPPWGTLQGHVTDQTTGEGIAGASVLVMRSPFEEIARVRTDDAGSYVASGIPMNTNVKVRVDATGYPGLWVDYSPDFANGRSFYFWNPDTQVLDVRLFREASTLRAAITDPTGAPVRASLELRPTWTTGRMWYTAGADGRYDLTGLAPGTYRFRISFEGLGVQWSRGKATEAEADVITLTGGSITTLDEQFLPRGVLELHVLDGTTGVPVADACVSVSAEAYYRSLCNAPDGVYTLADAPPGLVDVTIRPGPDHIGSYLPKVGIRSGETTRQTVRLHPAGTITTTVARAADGSIPRTCAFAVPVALAAPSFGESGNVFCNADGQGTIVDRLTSPPLPTGTYQLFIYPTELTKYGVQWLGGSGGTGDRRVAAKIDVRPGRTATAPIIKVDRTGSIAGTIRDRSTGVPLSGYVRPFGLTSGLEMVCTSGAYFTGCSGTDGRYRLDGLGPYAWPVEFVAAGHASQWSGGAADRFHATLIPVKAGVTTTLDAALGPAGRMPIVDRGPNPPAYWSATAFHALTGDYVGSAVYHNSPVIDGLNTGPVYIQYDDYTYGVDPCWYYRPAAPSPPMRRAVRSPIVNVTAGQTLDGIALVPGQTCLPTAPRRLSDPLPRRTAVPGSVTGTASVLTDSAGLGDPAGQFLPRRIRGA